MMNVKTTKEIVDHISDQLPLKCKMFMLQITFEAKEQMTKLQFLSCLVVLADTLKDDMIEKGELKPDEQSKQSNN